MTYAFFTQHHTDKEKPDFLKHTEESLRAILKGQKVHKPHTRRASSIQPDRIQQLMIDIAAKVKEGKGEGYARWAKKYNLNQLARSVVYLTKLGISSEAQMRSRLASATSRHDNLRDEIRAMDDRMKEISALQRHDFNYKKYRKIYADYQILHMHGGITPGGLV